MTKKKKRKTNLQKQQKKFKTALAAVNCRYKRVLKKLAE
jgi:hypothetical protein